MDDRHGAADDGKAELMLALLADARLPTGGHTQSAGLEPALRSGMDPARVPDYVAARLATVTRVEAATAVVARHAVLAAGRGAHEPIDAPGDGSPGTDALVRTWRAWAARTPSPALRDTSQRLGRGYVRLLRQLWAGHPAVAALDGAARALSDGDRRGAAPLARWSSASRPRAPACPLSRWPGSSATRTCRPSPRRRSSSSPSTPSSPPRG
ncbi:urease accessory UreF family protein [Cellulosimicrobium sp. CUA-896]|uniref:urease accessory UreF family protein n=1 Tax=Cellulosimicrobium sp. CUA-896 TaxID=1517881 RepID=UPI000A57DF6B|nr:urease accessory UreF family protein [Cellulosimicrobium sp. CUA-896]